MRTSQADRLFSSASAETISPALAVCSFTNSTIRPWDSRWPRLSVTTTIDLLIVFNLTSLRHWLLARHHAPPIRSIAVLPLDDLSGDSGQQYFADGVTDALITELGKVSSLRVISRQSVMRYKGSNKSSPQIARELGVEALIEGSVARDGGRVPISANLIDAFKEEHIWAERYDRDLGDILTVQSDFTQAIAREVQAKLTPSERARLGNRHVVNADAYEQYLKGQYFVAKEIEEGRRKAVRYLEQAIEIDPNDALVYAGIAGQYAPLGYYGFVSPIESDNKTVWAATKALELDDTLSEAHASPGRFTRFAVCFRLNLHRPWRKRTTGWRRLTDSAIPLLLRRVHLAP